MDPEIAALLDELRAHLPVGRFATVELRIAEYLRDAQLAGAEGHAARLRLEILRALSSMDTEALQEAVQHLTERAITTQEVDGSNRE